MSLIQPQPDDPNSPCIHQELGSTQGSRYSVAECPICHGGLCSVRVFSEHGFTSSSDKPSYGLILCDECEAIWLQPDVHGVHLYADSESPRSPVTGEPLYDVHSSRWANAADVAALGWTDKIDDSLTYDPQHDV